MKTLYLECNMGAAGDMLTAALLELLPDPKAFVEKMNRVGIAGLKMSICEKTSCGVRGTHVSVVINGDEEVSQDVAPGTELEQEHADAYSHEHEHEHAHSHGHAHAGMHEIQTMVASLDLPEKVKKDVMGVYGLIAEAEAYAHGTDIEQVHFHEVGMMDAITDISAVCLLMDMISPERVIASPIRTGFGEVRCMHGIIPVPAPATAYLMRSMPVYAGDVRGEMLTPTGAALLKYYVNSFERMPMMRIARVGCGMGMKEFPVANCVRAMLGDTDDETGEVIEISCNLDDMTGEAIGFAMERFFEAGALDVYLTAIQMKKNRPGVKLSLLCRPEQSEQMAELMLRHTTTLGVRLQRFQRRILARGKRTVDTPYGEIEIKTAEGLGIRKQKAEYASAETAALKNGVPLSEILSAANQNI